MNGRIIGGLVLILFGAVFLVNNLGLANIRILDLLGTWWPVILIAFGISMLLQKNSGK